MFGRVRAYSGEISIAGLVPLDYTVQSFFAEVP